MDGDSDILSLMLAAEDVFNEDDVIDEVLDLMVAGTQTTNMTTQFAMVHFASDPNSVKRARDEFT